MSLEKTSTEPPTDPDATQSLEAEDERPTVKLSASTVAEIEMAAARAGSADAEISITALEPSEGDSLDLPTMRLAIPASMQVELEAIEVTLDLTRDALPDALLLPALPFSEASESAVSGVAPLGDEGTSDILPSSMKASLPFVEVEVTSGPARAPSTHSTPFVPIGSVALPKSEAAEVVQGFDVVRVATIAAELTAGSPATVFARHGLDGEKWTAVERHWAARLANDAEEGNTAFRDAYDEAFLEAREKHRGAFGVEAFAELSVELENLGATLAMGSLAMDVADAMRFQRVFARRVKNDPALARRLEAAIALVRARRAETR